MRYIKLFEGFDRDPELPDPAIEIEEFLSRLRVPDSRAAEISAWWHERRPDIRIHHFPFASPDPIAGIFLGTDRVCINARLPMPPHAKLFIALHESRHCDQHRAGEFMAGYWDSVVAGDKETFLEAYQLLERDANDWAIASMRELGFGREMDREEAMLRGNERAGEGVWRMMRRDCERLRPRDFFALLLGQVV